MSKLLTVLILSTAMSYLAQGAEAAQEPVVSAKELTKEIKAINYSNEDERFKGGQKARKAVALLELFAKTPQADSGRQDSFKDLLILSREASPYDGEGQLAELLSATMKKDPSLKVLYRNFISSQVSSSQKGIELCKTQSLENSVQESSCMLGSGLVGQDIPEAKVVDAKKCLRPFNFESCLLKKSR